MKIPKSLFNSPDFQMQEWYQGCGKEFVFPGESVCMDESEWFAEPKLDGNWNILFYSKDCGIKQYSRSKKEKFYPLDVSLPDGTVLVGEIMRGSQYATSVTKTLGYEIMVVWDVLFCEYEPVMLKNALERRAILEKLLTGQKHLLIIQRYYKDFPSKYKEQHEGLVFKRYNEGEYIGNGCKVDNWIKVKKSFETDAVIMGYEKSIAVTKKELVATVIVGLYGEFTEEEVRKKYKAYNKNLNMVGFETVPSWTIMKDGKIYRLMPICAVTAGSHELGEKLVAEWDYWKYKILKVHHFGQFDSGSFRHPSAKDGVYALRDDKGHDESLIIKKKVV